MHRVVHRPRQLARLRLDARHAAHNSELERLALVPVELSSRHHQREEQGTERHRSRRKARSQVERRKVLHHVVVVLTPVLCARRPALVAALPPRICPAAALPVCSVTMVSN